jgi:tRNA (adenine57-N1/adenine58-N1)-methyltransferase
MHGHTGFLITTRRLAPGVTPPLRKRRPAKGAYGEDGDAGADTSSFGQDSDFSAEGIGERVPSDKKVRRVRRSVTQTSDTSE